MNPSAILALISNLYEQLSAAQELNSALQAENDRLAAAAVPVGSNGHSEPAVVP